MILYARVRRLKGKTNPREVGTQERLLFESVAVLGVSLFFTFKNAAGRGDPLPVFI
jgi:hypothetical protein